VRRLAVLAVLVIVVLSVFGTVASAKPRRYWCARAATLQQQIASTATHPDALAPHQEAIAEQLRSAGQAPMDRPAFVVPRYR
jgi:hypothetical protein